MWPVLRDPDILQTDWSMSLRIVVIHSLPKFEVIRHNFRLTKLVVTVCFQNLYKFFLYNDLLEAHLYHRYS